MQTFMKSLLVASRRSFASGSSLPLTAIKKLRDLSGAPLGDVKKALEETEYDFELAYDALRRKGLAAAAKKASRVATEGLIGVAATSQRAALVEGGEIRPEDFQSIEIPSLQSTLEEGAKALSGSIREKIYIRRAFHLSSAGRIFTYCHNAPPGDVPGLGKIACVTSFEAKGGGTFSEEMQGALQESALGQQMAMHVAGMRPLYLDRSSIDPDHLARERALLLQQASESGKPQSIVEKIVEGRLKKFYEEFCLLEQRFVLEEETTVAKVLQQFSQERHLPEELTIGAFLRVSCGEGLEPET